MVFQSASHQRQHQLVCFGLTHLMKWSCFLAKEDFGAEGFHDEGKPLWVGHQTGDSFCLNRRRFKIKRSSGWRTKKSVDSPDLTRAHFKAMQEMVIFNPSEKWHVHKPNMFLKISKDSWSERQREISWRLGLQFRRKCGYSSVCECTLVL